MGKHNLSFMPTEAIVIHLLNALRRELFPVPVSKNNTFEHIIELLILWNQREGYHSFGQSYGTRLKFYMEKLSGYVSLNASSVLSLAKMNAKISNIPLFLQTIFASISPSVSETVTFAEKLYKLFDISFSQNSKKAVVSFTQFEDPKFARPSFTTYLITAGSVLEDKTTLLHKIGEALDILYFKFDVSVLADYQKEKDKEAEMIADIICSEVRPYVDNVFEQFNLNGSLLTVWLYMRDFIHFNLITDLLISRSVLCQEAIIHKSVKTTVSKWLPIYKVMLLSASDKFVANSLIISEV